MTRIKIEITKDEIKKQHDIIQIYINISIITIYTNNSDIKNNIEIIIYNITINKINHQYLNNKI